MQQSSIFKIASIRYFYRFVVNLCFASAAFFAPVVPSRIRYPAVPVCKKCAKMCRAKISPLKQASDFYAKPGKRSGSSPMRHSRFTYLDQASNVHPQLRFVAGIWTTAISYKSKAALSMWTFLGGNTQRVHFFYFIDSASIRAILLF